MNTKLPHLTVSNPSQTAFPEHQFSQSHSSKIMRTFKALAFVALLPAFVQAQEVLAIKAKEAYLGRGRTLKNAVILIKDGKIEKVGANIEVPWNAEVVEAHYAMPAWGLAHTSGGIRTANESMPVTPQLTVLDGVDPSSGFFETSRRHGVGTVHIVPGNNTVIAGRGMVAKTHGKTPEEMAVFQTGGLKMSLYPRQGSRSSQIAALRKALDDALAYRKGYDRRKKEFEEDKANGATTKDKFEEEINKNFKPVLDLFDGKTTAYLYVPGPAEVRAAIQIKSKYRIPMVLVLNPRCYKAVAMLKRYPNIPMILDWEIEFVEKDPLTGEESIVCAAKHLYDAGLRFAITSFAAGGRFGGPSNPAVQLPWWQVATCVRHGIPERIAIEMFTSVPASFLGLGNRVGQIKKGMDANIQLLTAPIFEPESQVEYLVCEGEISYDRSKDKRMKALTGAKKNKTQKSEKGADIR